MTTQELDPETEEEIIRTSKRNIEMLFVRGDARPAGAYPPPRGPAPGHRAQVLILVSPPLRTT